jgi:peptidoglycan/LPS O-acetylase OafA/YrhL
VIEFLSGAVTLAYFIAMMFFVRFWRKTHDRLFFAFAIAFGLLGFSQGLAFLVETYTEPQSYFYGLRVVGFLAILVAVIDKNVSSTPLWYDQRRG